MVRSRPLSQPVSALAKWKLKDGQNKLFENISFFNELTETCLINPNPDVQLIPPEG
jgi:hypothetical protein